MGRGRVLALAAVGLITLGQWAWFSAEKTFLPGAFLVGYGMFLAVLSKPLRNHRLLWDQESVSEPYNRWRLALVLPGVIICLYTGWHAVEHHTNAWLYLLLWTVGTGLALFALVPRRERVGWWRGVIGSARHEWRIWLSVTLIFLCGLALRTFYLDTSPYIQAGDEAAFAMEAVNIRDFCHWQVNPFEYGIWHHPRVFHVTLAAIISLFGQTLFAARLLSALLGSLTVPAVYLMARRMFDHRVGLVAAVFMAAYPLHVHFSRTGINQTGDPLFAALTFAFLTQALRSGDRMEAALAGWSMGLSQYFYSAARLVPLLMLVYVGLYLLVDWRMVWKRAVPLLIIAIMACIVVFPNLYAVYRDKDRPLSPRLSEVSIWATGNVAAAAHAKRLPEYWQNQFYRSFMAYVQISDRSGFYSNYGSALGWFAGVPFLAGLAWSVRRFRDPRYVILGLWVGATAILGGVLLVDPPHYPRYISVTPGLAVLVGLGFAWFAERLSRRHALKLGVVLVLALAVADQITYITDYLPRKLVYGEPTLQLNEIADILETFDGHYQVYYFSDLELDMGGNDILRYRVPDAKGMEFEWPVNESRPFLPTHGPHAFLIAPLRFQNVIIDLINTYPGGEVKSYDNPRSSLPLVYIYFVNIDR
ncbi:MAG TPA: glycosyltransferase family 39 protein [Aggregatilineaceae bacterium]|nr:glycosyltransferase family 39 protein [Aggregatilineaceae bacterium]